MKNKATQDRRGAVLVLVAMMLMLLIVCASFCVDIGVANVAQHQLQTAADSAAIAGAMELLGCKATAGDMRSEILARVNMFASNNRVLGRRLKIGDGGTDTTAGLVIGNFNTPFHPLNDIEAVPFAEANAVKVHLECSDKINGGLPTFFSRAFGVQSIAASAVATAAFTDNFRGFTATAEQPAMILPITLSMEAWSKFMNDTASFTAKDAFTFEPSTGQVRAGADGISEFTIYPQSTGAGGNFGTIDIGSDNNNVTTLQRQVRTGLTPADLAFHGGEFALDSSGGLSVSGDPGAKIGPIESAMGDIIGQTRILPIFKSVSENGQRARYVVIAFTGIRILDAQLTSTDKRIVVQPAPITVNNGISAANQDSRSSYIFSPVRLVK